LALIAAGYCSVDATPQHFFNFLRRRRDRDRLFPASAPRAGSYFIESVEKSTAVRNSESYKTLANR
jgi:hypothetical protein